MKHNKKVNPLTYFNNLKAEAIKKAGGAMKDFKKSLPKAQDGRVQGPMTENQSKMGDLLNSQPPIPQALKSSAYDNYNTVNKDMLNKNVWQGGRERLLNKINTPPAVVIPNRSKAASMQNDMYNNDMYRLNNTNPNFMPERKKGGSVKAKKRK